uniref:DUF488 family protein, N3 subclade n=1 Tax=Niveibacterium sp. SC-1 TaxID=3135646 RepID=UPI004053ABE7
MGIRIVRLGSPREAGEGLRIGTVRRPPRGVPKAQWPAQDVRCLPRIPAASALRGRAAAPALRFTRRPCAGCCRHA